MVVVHSSWTVTTLLWNESIEYNIYAPFSNKDQTTQNTIKWIYQVVLVDNVDPFDFIYICLKNCVYQKNLLDTLFNCIFRKFLSNEIDFSVCIYNLVVKMRVPSRCEHYQKFQITAKMTKSPHKDSLANRIKPQIPLGVCILYSYLKGPNIQWKQIFAFTVSRTLMQLKYSIS